MIKTRNFNPITDPKLICTCGSPNCDKRSVKQEVLDRVQIGRDIANRPLRITSGGRCPNHPDELHRSKPADHQLCQAVDIACHGGLERGELVKIGIAIGFNAIGVGDTFVHWGLRKDLPKGQLMIWSY